DKMTFGGSKVYLVDPTGAAVTGSAGTVLEKPLNEYPWGEALLSQGAGKSTDEHLYTLSPIQNTRWSLL
ncbi:MAG TPA: hypothetical protein PKE04_18015, partial [Clostridia bacterium]|nr:hypothetical protein [Clostridia bacterium]